MGPVESPGRELADTAGVDVPGGDVARDAGVENAGVRDRIVARFTDLFAGGGGIDSWLGAETPNTVFQRLASIEAEPLTRSELNQLLVLSHEAGPSAAFFGYYWLSAPVHTYDVTRTAPFDQAWLTGTAIVSLDHLEWGLRRF